MRESSTEMPPSSPEAASAAAAGSVITMSLDTIAMLRLNSRKLLAIQALIAITTHQRRGRAALLGGERLR